MQKPAPVFYSFRKPPAGPVEVSRKKASASNLKRSGMLPASCKRRLPFEPGTPVYRPQGKCCKRKKVQCVLDVCWKRPLQRLPRPLAAPVKASRKKAPASCFEQSGKLA